ncbi:MAG TPA: hypothetical protein VJQ54_24400 [Candidatus Sulfotelmatobacter sp.]|nr:hypothetical protein [Candidatus Sulfotelmatobacter sp.]
MATGRKDDREAELEAAIEKIKAETWKPGQTLPKLRHAIAAPAEARRTRLAGGEGDGD